MTPREFSPNEGNSFHAAKDIESKKYRLMRESARPLSNPVDDLGGTIFISCAKNGGSLVIGHEPVGVIEMTTALPG
jgi:hypothetical protein